MRTVPQYQARLIGVLLIAGVLGLMLLLHVTSDQRQRCEKESLDISLIKLI
ncbi:MAG: hypothetical protein JWQ78_1869 [Sediminibacterium sp.]|nr:hypothetical protein [Sediminibacterium sp.]